jgi:diketogulonate reductase-like aldo/keto reductase
LIGGAGAAVFLPARLAGTEPSDVVMRAVPASGEKLPVIGLGTWQVFDVDLTPENENQLGDVLSLFVKLRGRVIDSSPMYGRSEQVIGALATKLGIREKLFFATKVWTRGKQQGVESMERSIARFQTKRIDLM